MASRTQIPDGWRMVRLGDVAEVVGGGTPSRANADFWGEGTPWLVPSELTRLSGKYLRDTQESITDIGMASAGLRLIPAESVLLTSRATIGITAINAVPVTTNQGFQNLIARSGTHSLWLYFWIGSMRRELGNRGSGSTFREVSRDSVRSLSILLPPLPEQRAIAAVLDAIDEAIERAEAVVVATERLRDALLHELLTRGVPGWHAAWKDAPGIGTIPASWEVVRLGEVAALRGAHTPTGMGDPVLYIGLEHIASGGQLLGYGSAGDFISTKTRFLKGDTLYGKLRPNLRKVLRAPFDGASTTEILAMYGKLRLDNGFLSCVLRRESFHRYAMTSITGTKMPRTSWDHLRHYRLALPPPGEQQAIAALLGSVDEVIARGRSQTDGLRSLKASAADALLTGRVRVGGKEGYVDQP